MKERGPTDHSRVTCPSHYKNKRCRESEIMFMFAICFKQEGRPSRVVQVCPFDPKSPSNGLIGRSLEPVQ